MEGDNQKYQIQKCNNLTREFPPILESLLPPPDTSLDISATTLSAFPPALQSSKYWGGEKDKSKKGKQRRHEINNLPREFPPVINTSLLPTDPSLDVSSTTLQASPPVLHSSNIWGEGEKEKDAFQLSNKKTKAAISANVQLVLSSMRSPHFPGTNIALL